MVKKIVLYGASGFGREVANLIKIINKKTPVYEIVGFIDDGIDIGTFIDGYEVIGDKDWFNNHKDVSCVCCIANVNLKENIQESLTAQGIKFESIIDPNIIIPESSKVGDGCIIYGLTRISVNVTLEDGVFLSSYISVGHDVKIGKYSSIMPGTGISGHCAIGQKVFIGGHSFIVPGKKIGDSATIAAGSVVFTNVRKSTTVLGNPAKRVVL